MSPTQGSRCASTLGYGRFPLQGMAWAGVGLCSSRDVWRSNADGVPIQADGLPIGAGVCRGMSSGADTEVRPPATRWLGPFGALCGAVRIGVFDAVGLVAQGDGFWPSCRAGMGKNRSDGQRRNTDWPGPRCGGANPRGAWGTDSVGQWTGMLVGEGPRGGRSQRCIAGGGGLRFRQRRRGLSRVFPREPLAVPWAIANGDVEQGWAGEGVAS